jgi:hypothetical protein
MAARWDGPAPLQVLPAVPPRRWTAGLSIPLRLAVFLLLAGLWSQAFWEYRPTVALSVWGAMSAFAALVVGTFATLGAFRNDRGEPVVTRTRWLCFVPVRRRCIEVERYGAVRVESRPNALLVAVLKPAVICLIGAASFGVGADFATALLAGVGVGGFGSILMAMTGLKSTSHSVQLLAWPSESLTVLRSSGGLNRVLALAEALRDVAGMERVA